MEISAEVHHRDSLQANQIQEKEEDEYESKTTITASETEDITPGQKSNPPGEDSQISILQEDIGTIGDPLLEVGDGSKPQLSVESQSDLSTVAGGVSQKRAVSTDEESDNAIGINVGTFVNRMIGHLSGSEKKKPKVRNKV